MADLLPWTCYVIDIRTGSVLAELILIDEPQWSAQINDRGSIQVTAILDGPASEAFQSFGTDGGKIGLALAYGEAPTGKIVQAGPIWESDYDDVNRTVTLVADGLWSVFDRRLLVHPTWEPGLLLTSESFDSVYQNLTLRSIANELISDMLSHADGSLPVDLPLSAPEVGTHTRTYPSHEMSTYGQRLRELTGVNDGPDVLLNPYFSDSSHVRWQMLIGNPYTTQSGLDPVFDYPGSLYYLNVHRNNRGRATEVIVRGNGSERATTYSYASDPSLISAGWPQLSNIDTSHTSSSDQATLDSWSSSILAQQTDVVETWETSAMIAGTPGIADYLPGFRIQYTVNEHPWVPDGDYRFRLIGYTGTGRPGEVRHILDARGVDV